jgi:hypothetical protein
LWDVNEVEVWVIRNFDNVLIIQGRFLKSGNAFSISNVYAPCDIHGRQVLRTRLSGLINNNKDVVWRTNNDFNIIQSANERRSRVSGSRQEYFSHFNQLMDENILFDLSLSGRSFTWYRGDRLYMSRLERFILSNEWFSIWMNCIQMVLARGIFDRCSLM